MAGTGSTFFSIGLFWRRLNVYLRFIPTDGQMTVPFFPVVIFSGCNLIDDKTRQKTSHYFPADCFGGSSDLVGTGSTTFFIGLFWSRLKVYLRFIPTDGEMTVPFFSVVIFSGRNLIDEETHQKT